jgi:hypothetical protein
MRDEGHRGLGHGGEGVIHQRDLQARQIRDVACDMEREDLALALTQDLVAAGPAFEEDTALRSHVAVVHDVPARPQPPNYYGQALNCMTLRIRERGDAL